jgi:hypothetical protein
MVLARLPVWPTMSGLAKLMMKTSVSRSSMARRILSVTLKADISGIKS